MELEEHYAALLGISSSWEIYRVDLKLEEQRVDIVIEYTDDEGLHIEGSHIEGRVE